MNREELIEALAQAEQRQNDAEDLMNFYISEFISAEQEAIDLYNSLENFDEGENE